MTHDLQEFQEPSAIPEHELNRYRDEFIGSIKLDPSSFRGWFLHAELKDIYSGNCQEFLSWVFFSETILHLQPKQVNFIESVIKEIEEILHHKFTRGQNLNVKCMRTTMDPVQTVWRPLMFYLGIKCLDYFVKYYLASRDWQCYYAGNMRYWYRNKSVTQPNQNHSNLQPIVFVHGLGVGVFGNLAMIHHIALRREMFILELPWVSCHLGASIPKPQKFVRNIEFMISRHGLWNRGACFVGHSYGTVVISWVLKYQPKIVSSLVIVEPVALNLCHYSVCYNFMYKKPRRIISTLVRWTIGYELTTLTTLARKMVWYESVILFDDLPKNSAIVMSKNDHIIDSPVMHKWLLHNIKIKQKDVQIKYYEKNIDHAQVLFSPDCFECVSKYIEMFDNERDVVSKDWFLKRKKNK